MNTSTLLKSFVEREHSDHLFYEFIDYLSEIIAIEKLGTRKTIFDYFAKTFDNRINFCLDLSVYIEQVQEGGHAQYFDNGYASNNFGDTEHHEKMIQCFQLYFPQNNIHMKMLNIMNSFIKSIDFAKCKNCECSGKYTKYRKCPDCEGSGEDLFEGGECGRCGGSGVLVKKHICPLCNGSRKSPDKTYINQFDLDKQLLDIKTELFVSLNKMIEEWTNPLNNK